MTRRFEASYDTIADFIGAPGRPSIALYRNTTEAINSVMYSLLTEFRDGDNVVTTMMEHNSNYVPWYAMCREILPRLGRRVEYRLARFDPDSGELDLEHLASLIDTRTKLVCCTGAIAAVFSGRGGTVAQHSLVVVRAGRGQTGGVLVGKDPEVHTARWTVTPAQAARGDQQRGVAAQHPAHVMQLTAQVGESLSIDRIRPQQAGDPLTGLSRPRVGGQQGDQRHRPRRASQRAARGLIDDHSFAEQLNPQHAASSPELTRWAAGTGVPFTDAPGY
jgi:hypothetical protein